MPADINDSPCHLRQELALGMFKAIATIDRLRMEHEVAIRQKAENVKELRASLAKARAAARTAQRILECHGRLHGCK
jgi:hypothetical protein